MQLALIEAAGPGLPRSASREAARIVRPWAMLAWGAVAYVAYTAYDGLPALLHPQALAVEVVAAAVIPQPPLPVAPPERLQMVTKCVEQGVTSYSDGNCAPGAHAQSIILAPNAAPPAPPAAALRQQVCADIALQVRRIDLKASLAPSGGDQAWLEARRREARGEQARLGC
ncbi:MAG TPA: DUF4124 domain-containing protein [Ramlibacter sp.]